MEPKLIIKKIGGSEIGSVTQTPSGNLIIQAYIDELQTELEALIEEVSKQDLFLVSGTEESKNNVTVNKTYSKYVRPGDPVFLNALADAISKPDMRIHGQRVRGYVVAT